MSENTIWKGSPSQWNNFLPYLISAVVVLPTAGVSILYAIYCYLLVRTWEIEVSDQRIIDSKGILNKTTDECELYRVKDIKLEEPIWLRLVGLSNLMITTSDKSDRQIIIPAIYNGNELRNKLRVAVEARRDEKGVKEFDLG
tara:strand:- start:371 stop:796 length:426 start_codon:yes stop_codon:yes gene_type:complete